VERQILRIEAGEYTEELLNYIFRGLTDEEALQLDVERERSKVEGLAQEPITIAVIIGVKLAGEVGGTVVASTAIYSFAHLLERVLDELYNSRKINHAIKIYQRDPELGKLMLRNISRFSQVALENEIQPPKDPA
jgi:hypothetical protein